MKRGTTNPGVGVKAGIFPEKSPGFTLLEVLVALVIISIGILGIAGMEALAISNTSVARTRSLAAMMGASLSSCLRANSDYWGGETNTFRPPDTISVTLGGALSDATLNGLATNCASTVCSADAMAAYDLKQWGTEQLAQLPGGTGTVACLTTAKPYVCTITISWNEKNFKLNAVTSDTNTTANTQTYTTVVLP